MHVIKRDGGREPVQFDKITIRLRRLCEKMPALPAEVDPVVLAQKVILGLYTGVTTNELDVLAAETAAYMSTTHPGYADLASRIAVSSLHKETSNLFSQVMEMEHSYIEPKSKRYSPLVSDETIGIVRKYKEELDSFINDDNDYMYSYFGFKTLERSYLTKIDGRVVERPQYMLMKCAVGIHGDDLDSIKETYTMLSTGNAIHASPTLFNSGSTRPQMSSCFLLAMKDDSIEGIYDTLKQTALISKSAGGVGLSIHNIRASQSYIRGTNGNSNGLVPMLRVFNMTARYVDQCFEPSTVIYTKSGPKEIRNVGVGDEVLTDKGVFKSVSARVPHDLKQEMLVVGIEHSLTPIKVTGEHQILALKLSSSQKDHVSVEMIPARLDARIMKAEMADAKDLQVGDFVCFPIPSESTVVDVKSLSEDDCYIYGLLVGGGFSCFTIPDEFGRSECNIEVDNAVSATPLQYLRERNIEILFTHPSVHKLAVSSLYLSFDANSIGFKFSMDQVYDESGNKKIDSAFLNLPKNKLLAIVKGIVESNRCTEASISGYDGIAIHSESLKVVESIRWILLRCGILTRGYCSYADEQCSEDMHSLCIPSVPEITSLFDYPIKSEDPTYLNHNGMLYSRVESITTAEFEGVVYDLEVDEHHTYVTHMGAVHNGGGKRKGAFAMYLEPWHADIFDFLQLKKNHGKEEQRARDLFYALWTCDLFMKRVKAEGEWSLFCPCECPGLFNVFGEEFEELYTSYEKEGRARKVIKARDLWDEIIASQVETGGPYMLYKDACNRKSNQQNLGTIRSSNLCTEIMEFTSENEVAVCNLASIALPKCVDSATKTYNHKKLFDVAYHLAGNLNKIIDRNYYPVTEAKHSNLKHRPIAIGVQGLADTFIMLRLPYESAEAAVVNREIFETMYFAALSCSCDLAKVDGPYESYAGSPASKGILQYDMWGVTPSDRWDWSSLKASIAKYGLRNSLTTAVMPTASTSQLLGWNECCEPYTSNIYSRSVLAGDFMVLNSHLMQDLISLGIWSEDVKDSILTNKGSVQQLARLPQEMKLLYKTVWEISRQTMIDMSAARGAFIDQSQSFNVFMAQPSAAQLTSMHFYAWKAGLKTGMYYLRTRPAADAIQFTVDQQKLKNSTASSSSTTTTIPSIAAIVRSAKAKNKELEKGKELISTPPISEAPFKSEVVVASTDEYDDGPSCARNGGPCGA